MRFLSVFTVRLSGSASLCPYLPHQYSLSLSPLPPSGEVPVARIAKRCHRHLRHPMTILTMWGTSAQRATADKKQMVTAKKLLIA